MTLQDLAEELFYELSEPTDTSVPAILFWLTSNIGRLNNLLDTEYSIVSNEASPELGDSEGVIYKLLYMMHYYTRQINKNLGAAAYVSISEVKEGNRTVKRTNKTEIAKNYRGVVTDLNDDLMAQVLNYKMNRADPASIIVDNPLAYDGYPFRDRDEHRFDLM